MLFYSGVSAGQDASSIKVENLVQSTSSWDGSSFPTYPSGKPEITILKITIAPHTTMKWHSHSLPSAGYVLSGDLTIEKKDGTKCHLSAGQAVLETMNTVHRGISGTSPVVLVVFYAGTPGLPLSSLQEPSPGSEK
jgi:quercetin dioxygenase-like cupin family protein